MSHHDPFRPPVQGYSVSHRRTSALAVLSTVFGAVSLMCICLFSLPFSLLAITFGHISRAQIRKSNGTLTGDGAALAGLILGYLTLGISVTMFGVFILAAGFTPGTMVINPPVVVTGWQLESAEQSLFESEGAVFSSTTTDADTGQFAQHYRDSLQELDVLTAESEGVETFRPLEYGVYVRQTDSSVIILVDVPGYAQLDSSQKEQTNLNCWGVAQACAENAVPEGDTLGVAIYSDDEFQVAYLGEVDSRYAERSLEEFRVSRDELIPYFQGTERIDSSHQDDVDSSDDSMLDINLPPVTDGLAEDPDL